MQTKYELIDAVNGLSPAVRQQLPSQQDIFKIDGRNNDVILLNPNASKARIWDIKKAKNGWAYFETDENGKINRSYIRRDLSVLVDFIWGKFCTVAVAAGGAT